LIDDQCDDGPSARRPTLATANARTLYLFASCSSTTTMPWLQHDTWSHLACDRNPGTAPPSWPQGHDTMQLRAFSSSSSVSRGCWAPSISGSTDGIGVSAPGSADDTPRACADPAGCVPSCCSDRKLPSSDVRLSGRAYKPIALFSTTGIAYQGASCDAAHDVPATRAPWQFAATLFRAANEVASSGCATTRCK
jgi:hypothetical protein